jgi:hypothetical protein
MISEMSAAVTGTTITQSTWPALGRSPPANTSGLAMTWWPSLNSKFGCRPVSTVSPTISAAVIHSTGRQRGESGRPVGNSSNGIITVDR